MELYVLCCILNFYLFWKDAIKNYNKITLVDLAFFVFMSSFGPITTFTHILFEIITIWEKK